MKDRITDSLLRVLSSEPLVVASTMPLPDEKKPHRIIFNVSVKCKMHHHLMAIRNVLFSKAKARERRHNFHLSADKIFRDNDIWDIVD